MASSFDAGSLFRSSWAKVILALPLLLLLLYLAFRGTDFSTLGDLLLASNFHYVLLAMLVGLLSHLVRAKRWQLLLNGLERPTSFADSFYAVMVGYFFNLLLPRAGEAVRCAVVSKTSGVKLEGSLGTMIMERFSDLIVFAIITVIAVVVGFSTFGSFLWYDVMLPFFQGLTPLKIFLICAVIALILLFTFSFYWAVRTELFGRRFRIRLVRLQRGFVDGFLALTRVKGKWSFFFWTLLLWFCYWLMTYIICLAMPATAHLGPWVAFTLLVVGTFGMFIPVQGGIGSFHLAITLWLVALGVSRPEALAYATLSHAAQTALLLIVPLALFLWRRFIVKPRAAQSVNGIEHGEGKK